MALDLYLDRYALPLEEEMRAALARPRPGLSILDGMLGYHLGWVDADLSPSKGGRGKQLRSTLCLLSCEALDGDWRTALPAAAAVELLHNFSLIHDDIEDGDRTRRGRPTVWALWGVPQAINAGDALFAYAELELLTLASRGVSLGAVHAAMKVFNDTCLAITEGQHLDIGFEQRAAIPVADYLEMVERKTAALIATACDLGALVAIDDAGDPSVVENARACLRSFGRHLGVAFQVQDDVLGIWGLPSVTGKPAGADITRHKKSLPILHGLEQSAELAAILGQERLLASDVERVTLLLEQLGSRSFAEKLAREHYAKALRSLASGCISAEPMSAMCELAAGLLGRDR